MKQVKPKNRVKFVDKRMNVPTRLAALPRKPLERLGVLLYATGLGMGRLAANRSAIECEHQLNVTTDERDGKDADRRNITVECELCRLNAELDICTFGRMYIPPHPQTAARVNYPDGEWGIYFNVTVNIEYSHQKWSDTKEFILHQYHKSYGVEGKEELYKIYEDHKRRALQDPRGYLQEMLKYNGEKE